MKAIPIAGVALLSVAATTFDIGLPVSDMFQPCPRFYVGSNCYYEKALPISLFVVAFTIGGIGIPAIYRLVSVIEKHKTNV